MIRQKRWLSFLSGVRLSPKRVLLWIGAIVAASVCGYLALPISFIVYSAPFGLEQLLFRTAYLFNVLPYSLCLAFWFVEVALLFLPLLGMGRKQMVRLAIVAYVILPVALYSLIGVISVLDNRWPAEAVGPEPDLVSDSLLLPRGVQVVEIKWSTDGRFLAINAQPIPASDAKEGVIVVLEVDGGDKIAQIPSAGHGLFWDEQSSLWLLAGDQWDVYTAPFMEKHEVLLGYVGEQNHLLAYEKWDFEPNEELLAVAEPDSDRSVWTIQLWKKATPLYEVDLKPKHDWEYGPRDLELLFSPDGAYLALVVSGWIGYEQPGPDELWVLGVSTGQLNLLHEGKTNGWQIFDSSVQDLSPSWSPTKGETAFGGFEFPVEAIDVTTGHIRQVLGWNSDVYDLEFSGTGDWIAFTRWRSGSEDREHCHRCLGVLRDGGDELLYLEDVRWPYIWYDWHPRENTLAVLTGESGHYRLLLWRLVEDKASPTRRQ